MNLNQIGELAGVSRMTVSRYFNGGYVSEASREKIKKVVEETGFYPNEQARFLKTKSSHTIGIIVSSFESIFMMNLITGIQSEMDKAGYQTVLSRYLHSEELFIQQVQMLISRGIEGLIVSTVFKTSKMEDVLDRLNIPVISIGDDTLSGCTSIVHDDYDGFSMLIDYLYSQNCRKIGCLMPYKTSGLTLNRLNSIKKIAKQYGICLEKKWLLYADEDIPSQFLIGRVLGEKIKKIPVEELPEVFIAFSDQIAIGTISYLNEAGIKIPQDIGITGYGNIEVSAYITPQLTTIDMNRQEIITKTVTNILGQINKNVTAHPKIVVKPLLIKRDSI